MCWLAQDADIVGFIIKPSAHFIKSSTALLGMDLLANKMTWLVLNDQSGASKPDPKISLLFRNDTLWPETKQHSMGTVVKKDRIYFSSCLE